MKVRLWVPPAAAAGSACLGLQPTQIHGNMLAIVAAHSPPEDSLSEVSSQNILSANERGGNSQLSWSESHASAAARHIMSDNDTPAYVPPAAINGLTIQKDLRCGR
eukprot:CAMPEP_0172306440 /NCGR_PEP_ID=MMETSP1058-20130122/7516_1 /TAXON_ID=83371 /ORGANISM="Detonula confervacea, Strain CCMP 353" /LENGTH=105 /DNA_ID=CAMNT_0013018331 /DNA_START=240 /DNA_END=554 /DNA_ORIENTATION=-